jgi:hypothetical protein
LSITLRIYNLDLHHFDFITTPEFFLSGPLVSCDPPSGIERTKEMEEVAFLSLSIESRSEGVFESSKPPILFPDP